MKKTEQQSSQELATTPEQQKCEDVTGHQWEHFAYEPDTNAGGYMECMLCGLTVSDDGFDFGSDFDDNVI